MSAVDARFWFSPGVEVMPGHQVPTPPPLLYHVDVKQPICFWPTDAPYAPEAVVPIQVVEFRLAAWSPGGEVAHYDRNNWPPDGWRWIAFDGAIHTERTRTNPPRDTGRVSADRMHAALANLRRHVDCANRIAHEDHFPGDGDHCVLDLGRLESLMGLIAESVSELEALVGAAPTQEGA